MLTLRPYQKEPVRKAIAFFREESPEPALLVLPTAAGKSIIAAEVAAACPDPILVVQPSKELLEQNLEKYRLLCGELAPAGIYSASMGKKNIDHVTFATIGSIKSIGAEFKRLGFRKMLIDEAHLYPRQERSMLGEFLRDSGIRHVLGMTATPLKLEKFSLKMGKQFDQWSELIMLNNLSPSGNFFKNILHITQIQEMTAQGYWSPLRYEVLPFSHEKLELNSSGNEYTDESVQTSYQINNVRANILAALNYHRERRHVIVFVPSVDEATLLSQIYPESAVLSAQTPMKERKETIASFKRGDIRVIFNNVILGTGFDYPQIDMVIMGLSTASVARYYQFLGRGVRIHPDKKDCIVVEAGGNYQRFGKVEDIRYEWCGKWQMFGSGNMLVTGIPVNAIGWVKKEDIDPNSYYYYGNFRQVNITFGKHKNKAVHDLPVAYLTWLLEHMSDRMNQELRANIIGTLVNHIRDTRNDPPIVILPDGKYVGIHMSMVSSGYLSRYYHGKEWNETNDSLKRGLEIFLPKYQNK